MTKDGEEIHMSQAGEGTFVQKYDEVLVDEYQDSNFVQETSHDCSLPAGVNQNGRISLW